MFRGNMNLHISLIICRQVIPKFTAKLRMSSKVPMLILRFILLQGETGCGLLIWMDEVASEWIPNSNSRRDQIEAKMEEMKSSIKR